MSSSQKLILDKLSSILSETDNSKSAELLKLVPGESVIKNKRAQEIDDKIERLLLAYKEKDELAHKKATEI